jgi:class 3 adenylate cyclase/tetratricopeptide (TPR) repeat protein
MHCPKCNFDNRHGVKFCENCGCKLDLICPECRATIPFDRRFCGECGHDLHKPKERKDLDYNQPKSYTPKHLAEKILTSRSAIEGERKTVTVLFADVAGSTSMFEKLDPEAVHEIMDGCFRIILDNVHRYEGTVNQFRGDGVMALFGAPIAHEDHAQRACHAALAIQKSLAPYSQELKQRYGLNFAMRIGLHSGPVVVAAIGDDLRMDYTAKGDTANIASRMESSAIPGSVLTSNHTFRLTREYFSFAPSELLQLKGKSEPIPAHRLLRATNIHTRIAASTARGLTCFVGRDHELEELKDAFNKARFGEGQIVSLVGEAGVGKSRLLQEFRKCIPKSERIYAEGQCLHYGGTMPYLPVLDLIRTFIGIKEGETEQTIQNRLQERIMGLGENLAHTIPPLQELLSITVQNETFAGLEPEQKQKKTFEAIRDLLIWRSQDLPLILALEDLHWIDRTTQELLDYLVNWLPRTHILLLLLYRPEYTHPWGSKSYYRMIGVNQLSSPQCSILVGALLKEGEVATELQELILSRASGNPLFLEELTHTLLENGSIERKDNHFVLTQDATGIKVPDTIQGIIAARMDRLEESLKRIMQVASVIGREFAFRILEAIADKKVDLRTQMITLQGLEFIYEKSLFPELEYIFRHALVRDVAYNSLLLTKRKEIHKKIGQAIENLYPERLEEFCEVLGYHYSASENSAKAYEYLKRSAQKAVRNNSLTEGVQFYTEAFSTLSRMPPINENKKEQIDLVLAMRGTMTRFGYPEEYFPLLQKAEQLAEEISEVTKRLQLRSAMGVYFIYKGGDPQRGWTYLEECLQHGNIKDDVNLMVPIGFDLCTSSLLSGDFQRVNQIAPIMIDMIERCRTEPGKYERHLGVYARILAQLAISTEGSGDIGEADRLFNKALTIASESGRRACEGYCFWAYGLTLAFNGDGEKAIHHLERSLKFLEETETLILMGSAWSWLGFAHCVVGHAEIGVKLTEKGLKIQTEMCVPFWRSTCHLCCSYAYFHYGDMDKALNHANLSQQFSLKNKEKQVHAISKAWLGRVLAGSDPSHVQTAEKVLMEAIQETDGLGLPNHSAIAYLWLAESNIDAGRRETGLSYLKKASAMFEEMGMRHLLVKAMDIMSRIDGM